MISGAKQIKYFLVTINLNNVVFYWLYHNSASFQ